MSRVGLLAATAILAGSALMSIASGPVGADPSDDVPLECAEQPIVDVEATGSDAAGVENQAATPDGLAAAPDCESFASGAPDPSAPTTVGSEPPAPPAVAAEPAAPVDITPAQLSDPVAPVTDYANYPDNLSPAIFDPTCTPHDGRLLEGLLFADDDESSDRFRSLTLHNDEDVTMSWTGFRAGCETTIVSFSVKRADTPTFDINENQELDVDSWVYCGTTQTPCTKGDNGRYSLTITMPPRTRACSWQADATYGPPLAVVGPDGSYYSPDTRGDAGSEMLVQAPGGGANEGANNGGTACSGRLPTAQVKPACAPGGIAIDLGNDGDIESEFDIVVDGALFDHVAVAPQATASLTVPAAEDSTHHVLITAETGTNPPQVTTEFDDDVLVDCEGPPPPTVALSATADCTNDAPYLNYTATPANAAPSVTLHWYDSNNVEQLTQTGVPLSNRVPYPGVVLDSQGNAIDWPGWVKDADGRWVEGADGYEWVRPTVTLTTSFNPTSDPVTVALPPGDPDCHPKNPPRGQSPQGLPRTGADTDRLTGLGLGLIAIGGLLVLAGRNTRRPRPAWRHLAP